MANAATCNMTTGAPWRRITAFALPVLLSQVFQQLYNTVDALIVGRFLGDVALAAVTSSGALIFLLVSFFEGLTLGAGVATTVEEGQHVERDAQGRWVLSGIDTKIDDLVYFVGTVSDHVLSIGGREISLRDLCGRNAKVRFSVRRSLAATNAGE